MSTNRKNKITVPLNSDAWNLVPDLTTMADTTNVFIKVASAAERDALASPQHGDKVVRTDLASCPVETYDSGAGAWGPQWENLGMPTLSGWTLTGNWYRFKFGAINLITVSMYLYRNGTQLTITGGGVTQTTIGVIAPSTAVSTPAQNISWMGFTAGAGAYDQFQCTYVPATGTLLMRGADGATMTFDPGAQMNLQLTYVQ